MGLLKNDHPERTLAADGSGSLRLRRQIHAAWGEHVRSYEWDWVATLTPRFADYAAGSLQREFVEGFVRRLSWREGAAVPWFAVTERGAGNVMHIHAMLAAKAVSIEDVRACWNVGISDVSPYDHNGNMALYLSKTLASPASSFERWNSSLTMPRRRAMNPGAPHSWSRRRHRKESSFSGSEPRDFTLCQKFWNSKFTRSNILRVKAGAPTRRPPIRRGSGAWDTARHHGPPHREGPRIRPVRAARSGGQRGT